MATKFKVSFELDEQDELGSLFHVDLVADSGIAGKRCGDRTLQAKTWNPPRQGDGQNCCDKKQPGIHG